MDGTLTEPAIDFAALKDEMGIAADRPILEALAAMPPDARRRAQDVLHRYEEILTHATKVEEILRITPPRG